MDIFQYVAPREAIVEGLLLIFTLQNMLLIAAGVALGMVLGSIPGLTSSMGVTLMIPLTYYLSPWASIAMLIGVYKGALFGDSIPAILMRTPGMPASAATMLDGHPLAMQKKPRKALKLALYSSVTADFISDLALILFAGMLAVVALRFGPAEYTMLIVFALVVIALVAGGTSFIRGLIMVAAGVLLAAVGTDPIAGSARFVFGRIELRDGIPMLPMMIGLLAVAEVLRRLGEAPKKHKALVEESPDPADRRLSWREYRSVLPTIGWSAGYGTFLGALPGIGATVAAFFSYAEAKRRSKRPQDFGNGSLEGVAAPEAGGSAVSGANMIPVLAFGIPGDVLTAIIMTAFLIHGITPGPQLFQQTPHIVFAIYGGLMMATVFNLIIGSLYIHVAMRLVKVSSRLILPTIIVLAAAGSYVFRNSFFDVLVMVVFAAIGYLLYRLRFNPVPLAIGFILGSILEMHFRRSLLVFSGNLLEYLNRPIVLVLLALVVVITYLILSKGLLSQPQVREGD